MEQELKKSGACARSLKRMVLWCLVAVYAAGVPVSFGCLWSRSDKTARLLMPEAIIFGSLAWPVVVPCVLSIDAFEPHNDKMSGRRETN